jgi:hypothetical protein
MAMFLAPNAEKASDHIDSTICCHDLHMGAPSHQRNAGSGEGEFPLLIIHANILEAPANERLGKRGFGIDGAGGVRVPKIVGEDLGEARLVSSDSGGNPLVVGRLNKRLNRRGVCAAERDEGERNEWEEAKEEVFHGVPKGNKILISASDSETRVISIFRAREFRPFLTADPPSATGAEANVST